MFAFSGRFRRRVAVLSVFALLAGVLVVGAPAAAADPKADYRATFSACIGDAAEDAGFTDVPEGHMNAGDIDCIAYYGVTKGTSSTTYSPSTSVTREQMALFLIRLAMVAGIDVDDEPADAGFTDIDDLSADSQMKIAQLADLGITQGTSATTYSPSDPVSRWQMALFISRLMNKMSPQADGEIGLSSTTQYGYIPSDVEDNDMNAAIGSPFTDIDGTTKFAYDAITNLYELGVATGVSDTSYRPDQDITRASMAGFMAAVLDHSNARPAGLTIQATPTSGWGAQAPAVIVSVRDDDFAAVEDQSVDVFASGAANKGLRKDGTCNLGDAPDPVYAGDLVDGDCVWDDNDSATDSDGNIVVEGIVDTEVNEGQTRYFHAWIGNEDGAKFDLDKFTPATVSVSAMYAQESLMADSDIKKHAYDAGHGKQVDLRDGRAVTVTAQLKDTNSNDVARSGVDIEVEYRQGSYDSANPRDQRSYVDTREAVLPTDEDGQVSFMVYPPPNDSKDNRRQDEVKFTEVGTSRTATYKVHWIEEEPVLTSDSLEAPLYVLDGNPNIAVTVRLWDQYGNSLRSHSTQRVEITYTDTESSDDASTDTEVRRVITRGSASWSERIRVAAGETVGVTYDVRQLARNSDGDPVRQGTGDGQVDNYADWLTIGQGQSDETKQDLIDDLQTTYNDGHVIVLRTDDGSGNITLGADAVYDANDDAADGTDEDPLTVDDPDSDDDGTEGFDTPATSGTTLITATRNNAASSNIVNNDGLDTYVDRGQMRTAPNVRTASDDTKNDGAGTVRVVDTADSADVGDDTLYVSHVIKDDDEFLTAMGATGTTDEPDLVYTYDDDDIFIDSTDEEAIEIDIARFETLISKTANGARAQIQVIAYDVDGTSIFRVKMKAS